MNNFASRNRSSLTIVIIIISIIALIIDSFVEGKSSTWFQWTIFIIAVAFLFYIHFIAGASIIEYPGEEYYPPMSGEHEIPTLQTKQVQELLTDQTILKPKFESLDEYKRRDGVWKGAPDPKEKTVYVLQPIHLTENEFNDKINEQNNIMEKNEIKKQISKPQPKETPVNGYSLHNIHQKHRGMYADICQFATTEPKKTEASITAKLQKYGHAFDILRPEEGLVAYKLGFIRIPEKGHFGVE